MSNHPIFDHASDVLNVPSISKDIFKVCNRNFLAFRQNWLLSVVSSAIEPVIVFLALGVGLGSLVEPMGGASYMEFLFPGFMCFIAFNLSFLDCAYGIIKRKRTSGAYASYALSPLRREDIALGEIVWSSLKTLISISFVFAVYIFLVETSIPKALPIYGLAFILVWTGAALGAFATSLKNGVRKTVFINSIYVFALSSINGVFFPGEMLSEWVVWLTMLSPVTHATILARNPASFFENYKMFLHVAALFSFFILFTNIAVQRFKIK